MQIAVHSVRLLLLVLVPIAAYAAEAVTRELDAESWRFWAAFIAVQILWGLGYAGSSLQEWAGWQDKSGGDVAIAERRLKIIQGMVIAALAGNIAYFGGHYYLGVAQVACFIGAAAAAWGGDKFLTPILTRITGRASQQG
jgi:hypothetical protein